MCMLISISLAIFFITLLKKTITKRGDGDFFEHFNIEDLELDNSIISDRLVLFSKIDLLLKNKSDACILYCSFRKHKNLKQLNNILLDFYNNNESKEIEIYHFIDNEFIIIITNTKHEVAAISTIKRIKSYAKEQGVSAKIGTSYIDKDNITNTEFIIINSLKSMLNSK